ncbi:MetQ/NlpA family ABC transporter substrate-binding protein [Stenotrophomonas sp. MMGLT7]|uniref:MetQ/NlpA family ABC transporter substrate-binding protein n=1 Tax=Stenotrophomonas sp. MMGLT7 TaxID=2901227 RepID=UPI001E4AC4F1|nr:MetQ/NlpA family ABC transporter substrate-binding protein [Stenotrophomonas sp. MMGLT7]MCD7098937.1 MetQ/NlpA family ABC transporter substrate-binding protein [Stenotrophomonas sp. MMGLT7]
MPVSSVRALPRLFRLVVPALAALALAACGRGGDGSAPLKVGATTGPHAEILEVVKAEAAKQGLPIEVVEFTDYVQPNAALEAGDLDANSYQHLPYLESTNADRGTHLVSLGRTFASPIAVYSRKYPSLDALPERARIAIPNDPTNGARSLLVLQQAGVIGLRADAGIRAGVQDIEDNPRQLRFVELDAAQLPRSLDDVDAAAVNTNYALEAGLDPVRESIAREATDSPYVNVFAVRAADKDRPELHRLYDIYRSEPVRQFILERYKGALVPAW